MNLLNVFFFLFQCCVQSHDNNSIPISAGIFGIGIRTVFRDLGLGILFGISGPRDIFGMVYLQMNHPEYIPQSRYPEYTPSQIPEHGPDPDPEYPNPKYPPSKTRR